jgi:ABC-type Fe3+ transport system substrate-binding protein
MIYINPWSITWRQPVKNTVHYESANRSFLQRYDMQRLSRIIAFGYIAICLVVLGSSFVFGPLGYAPFPLVKASVRPPVVLTIWYGSEKKEWLAAAKQRFEATQPTVNGRLVQIQLKSLGSREIAERVLKQDWRADTPPTVVSPSSRLWLDALQVPIIRSGADAPRPLVLSPLVVVGWEARSRVLWPNGPRDFWNDLQAALANQGGWKALGGSENWGPVKFGHTSPLTSNSGTQALMLMAYGFFGKSSGLTSADVNNPALEQWLRPIESSVLSFGDSTGGFMDDFVLSGPPKYDFGVVYENLALQSMVAAQQRQGQALRIFYPPATLLSDHPYAIVDGAWVDSDQRAAAAKFRDYLVRPEAQTLALQFGFRPSDPNVSISAGDQNNPFTKYAPNGVQTAIAGEVEVPPADVLNALIQLWQTKFSR